LHSFSEKPEIPGGQAADRCPVNPDFTTCGRVKEKERPDQCRFSAARFPHQAKNRIAVDSETDAVYGPYGKFTTIQQPLTVIVFYQIFYFYESIHFLPIKKQAA
jgi:hypothetical protein